MTERLVDLQPARLHTSATVHWGEETEVANIDKFNNKADAVENVLKWAKKTLLTDKHVAHVTDWKRTDQELTAVEEKLDEFRNHLTKLANDNHELRPRASSAPATFAHRVNRCMALGNSFMEVVSQVEEARGKYITQLEDDTRSAEQRANSPTNLSAFDRAVGTADKPQIMKQVQPATCACMMSYTTCKHERRR